MLSSVQRPAAGPRAPLTSGQRWFGIALVLIVSLGWLFPFVLSQVLSMHGMKADHAWRVAFRVSGVIACVIVLVLAYGRANDTEANREIRRARTSERALKKQSFKCVAPQVPGKFVVFPVRVVRRGVDVLDDKPGVRQQASQRLSGEMVHVVGHHKIGGVCENVWDEKIEGAALAE